MIRIIRITIGLINGKGGDFMNRTKWIESELIANYNSGKISRKHYLEQEKGILEGHLKEAKDALSEAQSKVNSINEQIAKIEAELDELGAVE